VVGINIITFFSTIFLEDEDLSYSLIEPVIVLIFYAFGAFGVAWMILCDYWKGIAYYDPRLEAEYALFIEE